MQPTNQYRQVRLEKLEKLKALGVEVWPAKAKRTHGLAQVVADHAERSAEQLEAEPARVSVMGRILAIREMGKSVFMHLSEGGEKLQAYFRKNDLDAQDPQAWEVMKLLDLGDFISVTGPLMRTKTGELSVRVENLQFLTKALLPLPEKWHGLHDVELRYRYRYLDLIANQDVRDLFNKRIETVREIRKFLVDRGFYEVETPMIQQMAGGAAANPFKTHYNALGADMYLRIAPELYLKRLLVGGFDKVFELNRNFRNEGLDRSHNPEFTMLEIYEAYTDVRGMMELVQSLITRVAQQVFGTLKVGSGEAVIDLTLPWRTVTYKELILEKAGADWYGLPLDAARERARGFGLDIPKEWKFVEVTHEIYEKLIEKKLMNPTFVTRFPVELVPLAKQCEDDPSVVDVFELVIRGWEVAPAYSELNDPIVQRQRLEAQAGGDASKIDEDFLMALEHGMPPAGGMGIGIDRLVMVLTGADSIRDVVLFPQLKAKG